MRKALPIALSAVLLAGGCSLIPDYLRPEAPIPASWPSGPAQDGAAQAPQPGIPAAAELGWRDFFRTPELQRLIGRALENNRDLRVAILNIEQARALYRIQESERLPHLDGSASATRQHQPETVTTTGRAATSTQYNVNLGVTAFELDLFGRVRSLEAQALEQFLATQEARSATQVALVAEVANAYLTLLADRELLRLTEETLATQQASYDLTRRSFDRGVASKLDVTRAQSAVETARSNRVRYIRQAALDRNALALLAGAPVDDLIPAAPKPLAIADYVTEIPAGLPSDLLANRPDIRQAEHQLKAANANIGAARAAFYPTITLTGSVGTASRSLTDLFSGNSGAWAFAPQLIVPIFDAGRNQANLDSAQAQRDIAVAQYEKAIQTAFREVADALAARGTLGEQEAAEQALVDAAQESYRLSELRYRQGIDTYLSVLDAQRSLYSAQQTLITTRLARVSNLVTMYKTLGGGGLAPVENRP